MSRGGCTPEQMESCPLMEHFTDTHHLYYPKRQYAAGVSKVFRELPDNKVRLCRADHNETHATTRPPERPSRAFMIQAIARQLTKDLEALHEPEVDPGMVLLSDDRSRPSLEVHMAGELTGRVAYAQEEV